MLAKHVGAVEYDPRRRGRPIHCLVFLVREGSLNLGNALKALMVIPASLVLWTTVSDLWAFVLDIAEPFVEAYRRRKPTGNSDLTRCSLDRVVNLFV